jgi:hypothetical protein
VVHRGELRVVANLADREQDVPVAGAAEIVLATDVAGLSGEPGAPDRSSAAVRLAPESAAIVRIG